MTQLIELKAPKSRFARSINVERDANAAAIEGYLPVGRAIDIIERLALALSQRDTEVAFSITGPYGSGKSSMAVVIDALLGPAGDPAQIAAMDFLADVRLPVAERLEYARTLRGAATTGFIRATVTADREPITSTVVRALLHGLQRFPTSRSHLRTHKRTLSQLEQFRTDIADGRARPPSSRELRQVISDISEFAPVLLIIDEFGKNLEAFADRAGEADLFLLQELAEWTHGTTGLNLALVTLQHMAFEDYSTSASATQRREWAKIQGRFEDIPFVDSPTQTRHLIASAFTREEPALAKPLARWTDRHASLLSTIDAGDLRLDREMISQCWPLHPLALQLLPELCQRYGQNERTLFSFLAGREPLSVAMFLEETPFVRSEPLPTIGLDRLYDYFVESAATMVSVSSAASRWIEIDSRIRDARGIDDVHRAVLKNIGILNLVSAGGTLRASRDVLAYAMSDVDFQIDLDAVLDSLEELGFVTYRDFAGEYRVWQGSDFDLKSAIDLARRQDQDLAASKLLNEVFPLRAVVAARHAHTTGTLRVFERRWIEPDEKLVLPLGVGDLPDGSALYVLGSIAPTGALQFAKYSRPVVFVTTELAEPVISAAHEVYAIDAVLKNSPELAEDWVAHRELLERRIEALTILEEAFEKAYGASAGESCVWHFRRPGARGRWPSRPVSSPSTAASLIADLWYDQAPVVRNDLVNRHELSSQASKARRRVIEGMLRSATAPGLDIGGFGPDRTLYLSVLQELGLHRVAGEGWEFAAPPTEGSARPAWIELVRRLTHAKEERIPVPEIFDALAAPPFGVREGVAAILFITALLVHADELALYEHGTFKPALSEEVCERLIRNPSNFSIKHFAIRTGPRSELLAELTGYLKLSDQPRQRILLRVVSHIVAATNTLTDYAKRSSQLSEKTLAIRNEILQAVEPDELLFSSLPRATGRDPLPPGGRYDKKEMTGIAIDVASAVLELQNAYPSLLVQIQQSVQEELRGSREDFIGSLASRAREIRGKVIEPELARLVSALSANLPGDEEWTEYVAMNVVGKPPSSWSDDDRRRFFGMIHDVGGTFRRIEALNAETRSRGDAFDAMRLTVTRSDGVEAVRLVWLDEARRAALASVAQNAVEAARTHAGSDAEARDLLLALLAEADLGGVGRDSPYDQLQSEPGRFDQDRKEATS